ncbi:MAG: CHASE3 domain-containing protein [Bdellovibrionia bacterium]
MKGSIGTKLLAIFGGIMACFIVMSIMAYRGAEDFIAASEWVNHTHAVLGILKDTMSNLKDAESGQRGYLVTGEERYLEPYEEGVRNIDSMLSQLKTLVSDNPIELQRLEAVARIIPKKLAELKTTINLRRTVGFEKAREIVLNDSGKVFMDEIRKGIMEMETEEKQLLVKRDNENRMRASSLKLSLVFGVALCLVIFIASGFFILRHISEPLKQIASMANQIAAGNLAISVPLLSREDEIGSLSKAFGSMIRYFKEMAGILTEISQKNLTVKVKPESDQDIIGTGLVRMLNSLRAITNELKEGSAVLSSSTGEILAVTSQVAAGATETAAAVSQTTSTVEEVKHTAMASSEKAKGVSENAKIAAEIAQVGRKAVEASIDGMSQIKSRVELITENIMKFNEQGQTIGEIIASVNDLAEQSNLLAVNASIEAARAGEQGKGFVVVAQEVKILADQSKQATAQVRNILNEIQKATSAAVMAAEQGSKAVETGLKQAEEAGKSISALTERVTQTAHAALQIAASSEQQLIGVSQVASAMESIKQASGQNVAGIRQVETAATNLSKVGQNLKELLEQYTL